MLCPALAAERRQAWAKLESRDHSTEAIFCHNKAGTDLMILGSNNVTMRNGVAFRQECAQRFKFRETENGYQITHFSSYIVRPGTLHSDPSALRVSSDNVAIQDSAPLIKAIEAAPLKPQPPMPENH